MKETRENKKSNERLKNLNSQRAITLIALVVTIVVLLILAGISLSLVLGENGIINKAKESGVVSRAGSVEDEVTLWKADQYLAENTNDTAETENEMLARLVANKLITADDEVDEENKIIIVKDKNGTVVKEISYAYTTNKVTENIFEYTEDGYITGIKDEYIYYEDEMTSNATKYASLGGIKIAAVQAPRPRILKESVGTTIYIPEKIEDTNIKGISANAFYAIKNLEEVIMKDNILTIGDEAFYFCKNLNNVKMSKELIEIGERAFRYCHALEDITIGNKVSKIGERCFDNTEIIDNVYIPKSVTEIGECAFSSVAHNKGTIKCEATEKPDNWDEDWNSILYTNGTIQKANVNWGIQK